MLLIGRVKREPNVRVIVHDKSSLAPEGKPVAFCLDPETGFSWIGEYDITTDVLLSGAGGNNATKTEQAERLILDLLADGKELASEDIVKAAAEAGISERTVQNAKRNMSAVLGAKRIGGQWYNFKEAAATPTRKLKVQNAEPLLRSLSTDRPPPHVLTAWGFIFERRAYEQRNQHPHRHPYRFPSDRTRYTAARYGKEDWKDNLSCQAAFQRNEQGNDDR